VVNELRRGGCAIQLQDYGLLGDELHLMCLPLAGQVLMPCGHSDPVNVLMNQPGALRGILGQLQRRRVRRDAFHVSGDSAAAG